MKKRKLIARLAPEASPTAGPGDRHCVLCAGTGRVELLAVGTAVRASVFWARRLALTVSLAIARRPQGAQVERKPCPGCVETEAAVVRAMDGRCVVRPLATPAAPQ